MTEQRRITDELREWLDTGKVHWFGRRPEIEPMLDRIDAAHEEALSRAYMDVSDSEWVRLPVDGEAPCKQLGEWIEKRGLITGPLDHDGELWHRGDMSDSNWGEIEGIVYENGKWFISGHDTSAPWIPANSIGHYHAPTVEDVLHSFICDIEEGMRIEDDIIAEYAKRLRLVGDAE